MSPAAAESRGHPCLLSRHVPLLLAAAAALSSNACRETARRPPSAVDAGASAPTEQVGPADGSTAEVPPAPPLVVTGTAVPPVVATVEACPAGCRLARRLQSAPQPEGGRLGPGAPLYAGDQFASPPDGPAELTLLAGDVRLVLWPGARLVVGLRRPGDLGLQAGGLAVSAGASPGGTEALRLFTPVGAVEPLGGRFVAVVTAGGRGLLVALPADDPAGPPVVLVDGLGGESPLSRGALHRLGPAGPAAAAEALSWAVGTPPPVAALEQARAAFEQQLAALDDERPATTIALARGLSADLEALEASRAENVRLLAERERPSRDEALRDSARRSVEAERAVAHRWYRLDLLLGAVAETSSGVPTWVLHASAGMERQRERVEALLRGAAGPMEPAGTTTFGGPERP